MFLYLYYCFLLVRPVSYTHLDVYKRQVQPIMAQDAAPAQTEQTTEAAVVEEVHTDQVMLQALAT